MWSPPAWCSQEEPLAKPHRTTLLPRLLSKWSRIHWLDSEPHHGVHIDPYASPAVRRARSKIPPTWTRSWQITHIATDVAKPITCDQRASISASNNSYPRSSQCVVVALRVLWSPPGPPDLHDHQPRSTMHDHVLPDFEVHSSKTWKPSLDS